MENLKLKDELAAVSHNKLMEGEQGLETLKLRNKFLQVTHALYYKNILTIVSDNRMLRLYYKCFISPSLSLS